MCAVLEGVPLLLELDFSPTLIPSRVCRQNYAGAIPKELTLRDLRGDKLIIDDYSFNGYCVIGGWLQTGVRVTIVRGLYTASAQRDSTRTAGRSRCS